MNHDFDTVKSDNMLQEITESVLELNATELKIVERNYILYSRHSKKKGKRHTYQYHTSLNNFRNSSRLNLLGTFSLPEE